MVQTPGLACILVQLLIVMATQSQANHNRWWSCSSECSRCVRMVTSMEDLIVQFYPGLFSQAPPGNIILSQEPSNKMSSTVNSGTAKIPENGRPETNVSSSSFNPAAWDFNTNGSRRQHHPHTVSSGCCETMRGNSIMCGRYSQV